MSLILASLIALSCPKPDVVMIDKAPWSKFDQRSLDSAKKRCKIHYEVLPCLITFYRVQYHSYYAVCGVKR